MGVTDELPPSLCNNFDSGRLIIRYEHFPSPPMRRYENSPPPSQELIIAAPVQYCHEPYSVSEHMDYVNKIAFSWYTGGGERSPSGNHWDPRLGIFRYLVIVISKNRYVK